MKVPIIDKNNIKVYISEWEERTGEYQLPQALIFPKNTYSPWLESEFYNYYMENVKPFTLVDIYRSYDLFMIARQLKKIEGNIIEIGVWRGGTGIILANGLSQNDCLYLCDTFQGVVKASEKDNVYRNGEHSDTSKSLVEDIFKKQDNVKILEGIFPEETSKVIENLAFKLCHIDVDVHDSAKDIFEWIFPRIVLGGIVVFDDYGFAACEGVTNYVNQLEGRNDLRLFYNLNGHAVVIKVK